MREAALRAQLQRYVSPRLADLAVADPSLLELRGHWREATVLFADIRGYTRLTETTPAPVVIRLLDEYLAAMIDIDLRASGHRRAAHRRRDRGAVRGHRGRARRRRGAVRAALDMVEGVKTWRRAGPRPGCRPSTSAWASARGR